MTSTEITAKDLLRQPTAPNHSVISPRLNRILIVLLGVTTFCLYLRTYRFQFVNYDDPLYVTSNWRVLQGLTLDNLRWVPTSIVGANWHPLTILTYMAVISLFGENPAAFHLLNALLHGGVVSLFFIFLQTITGSTWRSLAVAVLWGWHPLRVESVAWIAELKDVLCGLLSLLCMLAYVRYRRAPGIWGYALVAVLLVLALAAKAMAVTLQALFLLLDYWPLRWLPAPDTSRTEPVKWWIHRVVEKIPLLLLSLGASLLAASTQTQGFAAGSLRVFPLSIRLTNAVVSTATYIAKTLLPTHLAIFYPHPAALGRHVPVSQWGPALAVMVLITVFVFTRRRGQPALLVGWLWFLGTLMPIIGLVQVGSQAMADRYTYFPSMGFTMMVVWWVADAVADRTAMKRSIAAIAVAATVALALTTVIQVGYWRNTISVFSHADAVIPDNFVAKAVLSIEAHDLGDDQRALALARDAVRVSPVSPDAHHALAVALAATGQDSQALHEFHIAIKGLPDRATLHIQLGSLLADMKLDNQAMSEFRLALDLAPNLSDARHKLAYLLAANGKLDEAIDQWNQAIRIDPGIGMYHGYLGDALRLRGDLAAARRQYQAAVADGERRNDWEIFAVWMTATDPQSTMQELAGLLPIATDACVQTNHQQSLPLDALAALLARLGRFDEAATVAQEAAACADTQKRPDLAAAIRARMAGYREGRPYIIQRQGSTGR
jgi:protein O-mannosyl-transferase